METETATVIPVEDSAETLVQESDAVTVAYVHGNHEYGDLVTHSWHMSLTELVAWDLQHEARVIRGGWIAVRCGTDGLPDSRNSAIQQFLENRDSQWLCWIDTDMGFQPDMIDRLVEAADPKTRPVIGALCFSWKETGIDGMGGFRCEPRPTIFDWKTIGDETGFVGRASYPPNMLIRCGATGSAAILIHRSVLERMREQYGQNWYSRIPNPSTGGNLIGEDLSFCVRLGAMNYPLHVHSGIPTSHHKSAWISELDFYAYTAGKAALKEQMETSAEAEAITVSEEVKP